MNEKQKKSLISYFESNPTLWETLIDDDPSEVPEEIVDIYLKRIFENKDYDAMESCIDKDAVLGHSKLIDICHKIFDIYNHEIEKNPNSKMKDHKESIYRNLMRYYTNTKSISKINNKEEVKEFVFGRIMKEEDVSCRLTIIWYVSNHSKLFSKEKIVNELIATLKTDKLSEEDERLYLSACYYKDLSSESIAILYGNIQPSILKAKHSHNLHNTISALSCLSIHKNCPTSVLWNMHSTLTNSVFKDEHNAKKIIDQIAKNSNSKKWGTGILEELQK